MALSAGEFDRMQVISYIFCMRRTPACTEYPVFAIATVASSSKFNFLRRTVFSAGYTSVPPTEACLSALWIFKLT